MEGIKFYVIPKWEKLATPQVLFLYMQFNRPNLIIIKVQNLQRINNMRNTSEKHTLAFLYRVCWIRKKKKYWNDRSEAVP